MMTGWVRWCVPCRCIESMGVVEGTEMSWFEEELDEPSHLEVE